MLRCRLAQMCEAQTFRCRSSIVNKCHVPASQCGTHCRRFQKLGSAFEPYSSNMPWTLAWLSKEVRQRYFGRGPFVTAITSPQFEARLRD